MFSINNPFKLCSNRVWRTYTGGKLLEQWQGCEEAADGNLPEEWIASVINANNPGREHIQNEGYSFIEFNGGRKISLNQLIGIDPGKVLGNAHIAKYGESTAVLVKMLDSAERLTIQVHPDDETALKLFNSRFGKTEAWYIFGKREENREKPYILFGFKPGITRDMWVELFNKQDINGMLEAMHKLYVEAGQVYLIEGGIPHAIGSGCLVLEIQQPTDYTIRVEKITPKGLIIPDELCHQGLGFEKMFDCFNYDSLEKEEILSRWCIKPEVIKTGNEYTEKELIGYKNTAHFRMISAEITGQYPLEQCLTYSSLVILSGEGELLWDGGSMPIRQGETYFMPACVSKAFIRNTSKKLITVIRCFPPK
jgi:mannose-6-phosphate isomerase